ncbi:M28 family peptidase [Halogeometricum sp. S1BR25-6]|uniref:Carboxypeptidase Q n=1 Tax=Halogeometricum salsisoli TaxID=2950536 RepID=A0ABU2GGZ6_9EURY|nr:M28 family peptidase [Halogeometricum sp. S1BR25-6]MDS0300087.1 M28 family peptidase [Halogeometricum sp. S1BR25-6]
MTRLPDAVVGDTYRSTVGWDLIADLEDLNDRMPGHEGERTGADLVAEAFEDVGLDDVTFAEFPIPVWRRGEAALTVTHGDRETTFARSHELVELPGTPSGDVTGELVDVGYGLPEDFEDVDLTGDIAMASSVTPDDYGRWVHRSEKYRYAAESGAAGFVFYNHIDGSLPPTGSIGDLNGPGPIPAVGMSKEAGARLQRYCEDGAVEADLTVDCETGRGTSRNVEATVGPDTDETVLFTAHVDGHDVGTAANDNGFGTAMVVEVGKMLARVADELETKVRLVVFGAEETGLYGSYYWSHTHDLDEVKCVLNVDGAGYSRQLEIHDHGFEEISEAFDAVSDEYEIPVRTESQLRPHSDHWPFVQRGVAGAQGRSSSDGNDRGWGHTHSDTMDKLDVRDLRDMSILCAAGVARLAREDVTVDHVDDAEIRAACIDDDFDVGMKATGTWPWGAEKDWPWADEL